MCILNPSVNEVILQNEIGDKVGLRATQTHEVSGQVLGSWNRRLGGQWLEHGIYRRVREAARLWRVGRGRMVGMERDGRKAKGNSRLENGRACQFKSHGVEGIRVLSPLPRGFWGSS